MRDWVGLVATGVYVPAQVQDAAYIAARTGIPEEVIREKFGIRKKHVGGEDDHISVMALAAARRALKQAAREVPGFEPADLDVVIYCGSEYKDYRLWSCSAMLQYELGARRAYAFDLMALCAGGVLALKVARDQILADPQINNVLVVAASREASLVDYRNQRTRFMFNFGDGAAAAILRRNHPANRLLGIAALTDGSFHADVKVPAGGTVYPPLKVVIPPERWYLDVTDPSGMKERLDAVSLENFLRVIRQAVQDSGFETKDIRLLLPVHMKRSMHRAILQRLGLPEDRSVYLEEYGHVQAADQIIGLEEAKRRGLLRAGDLVVLVAAGTGYTWAAAALQWDPVRDI